ncbi:MAG: HK97 family phage prohead protease [Ilumatobacteraceae bacterium]
MTELLIRSADFEISGDGRTLEGLAVPYDRPSQVSDKGGPRYWEEFDPHSADNTIRLRSLRALFVEHEHIRGSVGEVGFSQSAEGTMFRARMTDSVFATTTLARVNGGELPAVSIGFRALRSAKRSDPRGPVTRRLEVAIDEMSLARVGQHAGAGVLQVRSEDDTPRLDDLRRRKMLLPLY